MEKQAEKYALIKDGVVNSIYYTRKPHEEFGENADKYVKAPKGVKCGDSFCDGEFRTTPIPEVSLEAEAVEVSLTKKEFVMHLKHGVLIMLAVVSGSTAVGFVIAYFLLK